MTALLLALLALLPAGLLLHLILYMDRNEREPLGLVLKVMLLGALGFVPAVIIETILGRLPLLKTGGLLQAALESFLSISPAEELCKMAPVFLLVWNDPSFNEENDGIVYCGASALGFAAVENLFYVLSRGFGVGLARALTSMPLHCFAGAVAGYYIGRAKFAARGRGRLIGTGFLLAYLAHGLYDTLAFSRSGLALLLLPMVAAIFFIGLDVLRRGRKLSLARSQCQPAPVPPEVPPATPVATPENQRTDQQATAVCPTQPAPRSQTWKAVTGRILLGASACFWLLLAIGLAGRGGEGREGVWFGLLGGGILSFVPVLAGVLLEVSYQRVKKKDRIRDAS